MTPEDHLVSDIMSVATPIVHQYLDRQPEERRQRLDGIDEMWTELVRLLQIEILSEMFRWLSQRAEEVAGTCRICRKRCQREVSSARVHVKSHVLSVEAVRFRCRQCKTSRNPVREWLGLQSGMTSAGFDRSVTALSTEMSFGRAAKQLKEQHGHDVDRTLIERRTYQVGQDAITYLAERRATRIEEVLDSVGMREGADRVFVQTDGGSVPVGKLDRPEHSDDTELTPVRRLPKGKRNKTKREVRVGVAWPDGIVENKVTDLHIAPHGHPEFSGERLYWAALEAGLGDNTHVHCTCDMGNWHVNQFEEQFSAQKKRSLCADFYHALEYISEAGRVFHQDLEAKKQWTAIQASRLKAGNRQAIVADLQSHRCCDGGCVKTDRGECAVVAARRYLKNHGQHMDYPRFIEEDLLIGSGEVEGRIRHLVRRRLDVPGDWREENLPMMLALITIRESGWWDEFWKWRDERDKAAFRRRLQGEGLNRFRGKARQRSPEYGTASERAELDDFCAEFDPMGCL